MEADKTFYESLIYSRGNDLQVWKGTSEGRETVIKVIYFNTLNEANNFYKEVFSMMRFKDIQGVATVYDCQISQANERYFIRIIMKYYRNGDLKQLIQSKISARVYFSENELMSHLTRLVNIFAYFEEKSIAHRDIKPENIFVDDDYQLVVGDLGCALEFTSKNADSLAGTPLYLSPELRVAYISLMKGENIQLNCDYFKSDVYSLGMTFIYMMTLQSCEKLIKDQNPDLIIQNIQMKLDEFYRYYPRLTSFLIQMLNHSEQARPNFITLKKKLMLGEIKTCSNCLKNAEISMILDEFLVCGKCFGSFQEWILQKNDYYQMNMRQSSLKDFLFGIEFCILCDSKHSTIESCTFKSMENIKCCNMEVIHNSIWKKCQVNMGCSICVVCSRRFGFNHNLCTKLTQNPRINFIFIQ
jgi:serine/threonine protein kinase